MGEWNDSYTTVSRFMWDVKAAADSLNSTLSQAEAKASQTVNQSQKILKWV